MSCDAVAAAVFFFTASTSPMHGQAALIRVADTPPSAGSVVFQKEAMFVDIVQKAGMLLGQTKAYRDSLKTDAEEGLEAYSLFQQEVKRLSDMDFAAHKSLEERGLDGDLKCILRGISADLGLKLGELDAATDLKSKDKALKELSYLLNDNVEVITAPPAPPV